MLRWRGYIRIYGLKCLSQTGRCKRGYDCPPHLSFRLHSQRLVVMGAADEIVCWVSCTSVNQSRVLGEAHGLSYSLFEYICSPYPTIALLLRSPRFNRYVLRRLCALYVLTHSALVRNNGSYVIIPPSEQILPTTTPIVAPASGSMITPDRHMRQQAKAPVEGFQQRQDQPQVLLF